MMKKWLTGIVIAMGMAASGSLGDCSGAEWLAFGAGVADCMLNSCGLPDQTVHTMQTGDWGTLGKSTLGCVLGCAAQGGLHYATREPTVQEKGIGDEQVQVRLWQ